MKNHPLILLFFILLLFPFLFAQADEIIEPAYDVSNEIQDLLTIAGNEVGYTEGSHGYSKYGEWAGDPYAQWCAEYLCWCVDQTDSLYGTQLSNQQYPIYSGQNVGRDWFIREGRYVSRNGQVDGWGSQWLHGADGTMKPGDYIPQPGDWVFFTWTSGTDTDHVAMVEYCTRSTSGNVIVHVLEGNAPSSVQRNSYTLTSRSILGFGTVHDVMDITIRHGNTGKKVLSLQKKLCYLSYLDEIDCSGYCGGHTINAVKTFQQENGLNPTGLANQATQLLLNRIYNERVDNDPSTWTVLDDE